MKYHKGLTLKKWQKLSLVEQLANVGSEGIRGIHWKKKNARYSRMAFYRALELLNLTKADRSNSGRLKEVCRIYEVLVDYFYGDNVYGTKAESLEKYFTQFSYISALRKGK